MIQHLQSYATKVLVLVLLPDSVIDVRLQRQIPRHPDPWDTERSLGLLIQK